MSHLIHEALLLLNLALSILLCWWAFEFAIGARRRRKAFAEIRDEIHTEIRGLTLDTLAAMVARRILGDKQPTLGDAIKLRRAAGR